MTSLDLLRMGIMFTGCRVLIEVHHIFVNKITFEIE
jgi:hypothetical protein